MNLDYTKVTHEQLLDQFRNRLLSDPRFKNLSAAAIYQIYMEMMSGTFDMLHFYLGRTAEEMFFESAKLDSSGIKLSKNLGYNPRRAIPATAEIAVKLTGPLPKTAAIGDTIWFNNESLKLSFNNKPYRLDHCYSYTLDANDIATGVDNPNWQKTISYSIPHDAVDGFIPLSQYADALDRIRIVQCSIVTEEIYAVANAESIGNSYQCYDVNNIKFSNWYGKRDPFAYSENKYVPADGWCKIGIGLNKTDAFSPEKLCDIEIENVYCNPKVKAANAVVGNTKKLNVCRVETNQDKTVRITFGDGSIVNNGFNNGDEILYVQYVETDGYAANTPDVVGCVLDNSSKIMAHAPGKLYDLTKNVSFVLTTNISNGDDFESLARMKINAAVWFASRGQLVNEKDFNAYFASMSKPIAAKNAIAWTTTKLKNRTNYSSNYSGQFVDGCNKAKDAIFYTVIGDLYESLGNDRYKVKELYTSTDEDYVVGSTTLYNNTDDLLQHISDLSECIRSDPNNRLQTIAYQQANDKNDPFHLNTVSIYNDIEEKLPFGVMPISIPPIVQYFDLVGTVEIDRTTNVADYQSEIESKIYKWLVDRQGFNNKIYKSDLIKLIYDNKSTRNVSVDLTPSTLTKDTANYYFFGDVKTSASNEGNYITSINGYTDNVIVINRISDNSIIKNSTNTPRITMSESLIRSALTVSVAVARSDATTFSTKNVTVKEVTELSDGRIQIILNDSDYSDIFDSLDQNTGIWLGINNVANSFYAYKPGENTNDASYNDYIRANNQFTADGTMQTPVPLPYIAFAAADVGTSTERALSYGRSANKYSLEALNEKSFNFIICDSDLDKGDYIDLYKCVKHVIEDSILDDNNNIVNYTLPNEISVVRVMLNYTYGR
jgi:hypothetical protein